MPGVAYNQPIQIQRFSSFTLEMPPSGIVSYRVQYHSLYINQRTRGEWAGLTLYFRTPPKRKKFHKSSRIPGP